MTASEQSDVAPNASPASPSAAPAGASSGPAADPAEQLTAAKKEAADNYDRYLRAVADLENFRRRALREKEELRQFAAARVLEDLLPVLDNLALGLAAARQPGADAKTLVTGVELVLGQLKALLAQQGLKEISPAAGQAFDPHQHESISPPPRAGRAGGPVPHVLPTGFALNGRLPRPANLVLPRGPAPQEKK